ncbi:hypothetical protein [Lichenibacterium dinghuense]|uniref:hypothetical protein n=1 Tax=Lichenibacterium dinghuense TaxID=2895977 RepID=UPI001F454B9A|nr:hypothetical protein [Lichenibacterium sp. 6Y81]
MHAARVGDPGALRGALEVSFAHLGPALVDVVTNRAELTMPPKITVKKAVGFSLWVVKAVLNERGDEVIDFARTNTLSSFLR